MPEPEDKLTSAEAWRSGRRARENVGELEKMWVESYESSVEERDEGLGS